MFISKAEKKAINARLASLEIKLNFLELNMVSKELPVVVEKPKRIKWTEESKAAASERMKKSWADRKAKKEAE
jgi:hypothetical protein